jgi:eukaryotic-like serine/threonine-protein kinase
VEGGVELVSGQMLGPYQLVGLAGVGGMAEVWQAFQPRLDRYVAIKVLPHRYAAEPGFLERFEREAQAISRLDHPNILTAFDFGEQDGFTYMVTPFIGGGTLAERLGRRWSIAEVLSMLEPLGAALDYAHAQRIVHRDVKPSNVLLTEQDRVILSDFGLARILELSNLLTHTGTVIGTPSYMSPEQADCRPATPASDLYSLGVIAYELLTGQVPFEADTPLAVALAHLYKPLPPPRSVNPELSEAAAAVLLKALAKDPADRYQSGAALAEALALVGGAVRPTLAPERPPTALAARLARARTELPPSLAAAPELAAGPVQVSRPPAQEPLAVLEPGDGSTPSWRRWLLGGMAGLALLGIGLGAWRGLAPAAAGSEPAGTVLAPLPATLSTSPGPLGALVPGTIPTLASTTTPLPTAARGPSTQAPLPQSGEAGAAPSALTPTALSAPTSTPPPAPTAPARLATPPGSAPATTDSTPTSAWPAQTTAPPAPTTTDAARAAPPLPPTAPAAAAPTPPPAVPTPATVQAGGAGPAPSGTPPPPAPPPTPPAPPPPPTPPAPPPGPPPAPPGKPPGPPAPGKPGG